MKKNNATCMSMTGFASHLITIFIHNVQTQLSITIKSLNSRFFEVNCKLPYALSALEIECIKLFKATLKRGYITFTIQTSNPAAFKGSVQAETNVVKSYIDACKKLQEIYQIPGTLTINDIIQIPHTFSIEEQIIDEKTKQTILETVNKVLTNLMQIRMNEGKALQHDLEQRLNTMQTLIEQIEKKADSALERHKKEITKKLTSLEMIPSDLTEIQRTTLYLELNKIAIHEEIIRFKNHVTSFHDHLFSSELEKGKQLDFIVQELNREINTIAAKCADAQISNHAIAIKVELEKAREQIQNIV